MTEPTNNSPHSRKIHVLCFGWIFSRWKVVYTSTKPEWSKLALQYEGNVVHGEGEGTGTGDEDGRLDLHLPP